MIKFSITPKSLPSTRPTWQEEFGIIDTPRDGLEKLKEALARAYLLRSKIKKAKRSFEI